jgi:ubiquitin-protein ligase
MTSMVTPRISLSINELLNWLPSVNFPDQVEQSIILNIPELNKTKKTSKNTSLFQFLTDFKTYCLIDTQITNEHIEKFNIKMALGNVTIQSINHQLIKLQQELVIPTEQTGSAESIDPFNIYQQTEIFTKYPLNYIQFKNKLLIGCKIKSKNLSNIPEELLLKPEQMARLIVNEVKNVNHSRSHAHQIIPDKTNPFIMVVRIKYNNNTQLGQLFSQIKTQFGYDWFEFKLILDNAWYPFIPPKLIHVKPRILINLAIELENLPILKTDKWNPTINLDYLITNIADKLEPFLLETIKPTDPSNALNSVYDAPDNGLEYKLMELANITNQTTTSYYNLNMEVPKFNKISKIKSSNGIGYGTLHSSNWNVDKYIKEQGLSQQKITTCLQEINKLISETNYSILEKSILIKYIHTQLSNVTLLEYEKDIELYQTIFSILDNMIKYNIGQDFIDHIGTCITSIYEEMVQFISDAISNTPIASTNGPGSTNEIGSIINTCDKYFVKITKHIQPTQTIQPDPTNPSTYISLMKSQQLSTYAINQSHLFYSNKDIKLSQPTIKRILTEMTGFKKNLPLEWESSVWVRISKTNLNLFSFMISGPKSTPYENGLFEFDVEIPANYPNVPPNVLIKTTGNQTVRFNPNLYSTGKVCLSLLGTWSGHGGENWNNTSTCIQVMVSIQSLILVDHPYFNEPGYESTYQTPMGMTRSELYNNNLYLETINWAMINQIVNPPNGFESVVMTHFKLKRQEIFNQIERWKAIPTLTKSVLVKLSAAQSKLDQLIDSITI